MCPRRNKPRQGRRRFFFLNSGAPVAPGLPARPGLTAFRLVHAFERPQRARLPCSDADAGVTSARQASDQPWKLDSARRVALWRNESAGPWDPSPGLLKKPRPAARSPGGMSALLGRAEGPDQLPAPHRPRIGAGQGGDEGLGGPRWRALGLFAVGERSAAAHFLPPPGVLGGGRSGFSWRSDAVRAACAVKMAATAHV